MGRVAAVILWTGGNEGGFTYRGTKLCLVLCMKFLRL